MIIQDQFHLPIIWDLTWEPFINEGVQLVHYVAHGRELPTAGPHCHVHTKVVRGIKGHCNT